MIIKLISLLLSWFLVLLPASPAEKTGFAQLTGLDALEQALQAGSTVESVAYSTGTKIDRGFVLTDEAEIDALLEALCAVEIAGTTDEFVTDMYPSVTLTLSDGGTFLLTFDGSWLTADGVNYVLKNDEAFWQQIGELLDRYSPPDAPEPRYVPNSVDLYFPANPAAGYIWSWEVQAPCAVSVRDNYFPGETNPIWITGAGGTHWFHFDGLFEGTTAVTLRYGRPWEDSPAASFTFRLTVDEGLNVLIWGVEADTQ